MTKAKAMVQLQAFEPGKKIEITPEMIDYMKSQARQFNKLLAEDVFKAVNYAKWIVNNCHDKFEEVMPEVLKDLKNKVAVMKEVKRVVRFLIKKPVDKTWFMYAADLVDEEKHGDFFIKHYPALVERCKKELQHSLTKPLSGDRQ